MPLERLDEAQDLFFFTLEDEGGRLLNVDILLQFSVEKGGLDDHVIHGPALACGMHKEEPHRF